MTHWSCIQSSLVRAHETGQPTVIVGDFNARHSSWDTTTDSSGNSLHHTANNLNLSILNCAYASGQPTFPRTPSVLDLALCNCPHLIEDMRVAHDIKLVSDHYPLLLTLRKALPDFLNVPPHNVWDPLKANWNQYSSTLERSAADWLNNARSSSSSFDDLNSSLLQLMISAANVSIPIKHSRPGAKPWFSAGLKKVLRVLHRAKRTYFRNKSEANFLPYRLAQNSWQTAVRKAKQEQNDKTIARITDPKNGKLLHKMWKQISKPPTVPLTQSPSDIHRLGTFFASTMTDRPNTLLSHGLTDTTIRIISKSTCPHSLDSPFSEHDVARHCRTAKASTASGLDNIHPEFLRHSGPSFHAALTFLFNQSWASGQFPAEWKRSKAVPLYKGKGNREDPSNYRLICVTSIVSRTFERVVFDRLCSYLNNRKFFTPGQAGFRKGFSTSDNLFLLQRSIYSALRKTSNLPVAFLDISKAFDAVWHNGLLLKLSDKAGVDGCAWKWIRSFLTNRSFSIVGQGHTSSPFNTSAGVPQGCVLSPLLFLIYINDLPQILRQTRTQCLLYADDIALYPLSAGPTGHRHLQWALDIVGKWAAEWKVVFSADKSQVVCFNNSQRAVTCPNYHIASTALKRVSSYRYLGVTFQENGRWQQQFESLCPRLHKSVFAIERLVSFYSSPSPLVIIQLMQAPLSQLEYGLAFWRPSQDQYNTLLNIIIRPLRRCLALPRYSHRQSILKEFGFLSLMSTRHKCILQFSSRVLRLPPEHPSSKAWLQDLVNVTPKSQCTFFCRQFVTESHEVMSLTHSSLPTHNSQLITSIMHHDTSAFLSARFGSSLRDCRRNYDGNASYLFSTPILYTRILARLRLDVAPINFSLHLRKLAPSP